jgi:DNA (cytosine-5)-methyltransferase 1
MRSVELFSGCGGLALGLSRAGFQHELMVEWDFDAVETVLYNKRRGIRHVRHWPIEQTDVREICWADFAGIDLIAGGPPCQPFAINGKHLGHKDRRDMWPEAIRAVREAKPRAFLFENVRGLARPAFADYLRWIVLSLSHPDRIRREGEDYSSHLARLEAAKHPHYLVTVLQVNAADYGAPQKRHRVIIVGLRYDLTDHAPELPSPTHTHDRLLWEQWVTGDYWKGHGLRQPPDHHIETRDWPTIARLRTLSGPPFGKPWITVREALDGLGEPNGKANHVHQPGARTYTGHTGSQLDQPAKALKAGDHGVPGGENMMVLDTGAVRYFTTRESARLVCLPDNYLFPRSWTESMRQLGNAVPAVLGEAIGRWLGGRIRDAIATEKGLHSLIAA